MPLRPDMEPQEYLAIFLRRKWLVIFSILSILFGASVYCVVVPELYKSTTTILIIPQRVPENYVRSTVSIRIEDRLATIQQQVMSRTRLQTVMDELGVFKEERKSMPLESVLEIMRKRIDIQVRGDEGRGGSSRGNESFSLSFAHENRQMAMLTAARLASFFIDENLKTREQQAIGTSEFLESQLNDTKAKLAEAEERMKRYKMRFMGELPEQLQANLNMLTRQQDQMRANGDAIRSAEDRKVFLEAQLSTLERSLQAQTGVVARDDRTGEIVSGPDPAQPLANELNAKRTRLAELAARYTERYPEIPRLRKEVEQLEAKITEVRKASERRATEAGGAVAAPAPVSQAVERDLNEARRVKAQIIATAAEIASLKKEREGIQAGIAQVQARVEQSPRREQEMIEVTRDYQNIKASYDDLLKKKLEADISQNLEKRQKGEQFQVLDPANLPEAPFKPDRKRILGVALMLALALGLGGPILLESIDQTLRGPKDFKHYFQLPVLASVPLIQNRDLARKKTVQTIAVAGGLVSFTLAVTVFLVLYGEKIRAIIRF